MGDEQVQTQDQAQAPIAPQAPAAPALPQAPPAPALEGLGTSAPPQRSGFLKRFTDAFQTANQNPDNYTVDQTTGQITKKPGSYNRNVLASALSALEETGDAEAAAQERIANTKFSGGVNGRAYGAAAFTSAYQQQQALKQQQQQASQKQAFSQAKEESENVRQSQDLKLRQAADARAQADNMINAIKGYNTNLGEGYVPKKLGGADVPEFANAEDAFKFMNQNGDQLHKDYTWRIAYDPATKKYQVMEREPNFNDRQDRTVSFLDGSSEQIHGATQDEANNYMKQRNAVIQQKEPLLALENDPNQAFNKENFPITMAYLDKRLNEATDDDGKQRVQKLITMGNDVAAERIKETHAAELSNLTVAKAQSIVAAPKGTYTDTEIKQANDYLQADINHKNSIKTSGEASFTGAALDQTATRYAKTGVLPPMGYGAAAQADRMKVINRAAELFPHGDVSLSAADYKALSGSLSNVEKQFDSVTAFENTADKNLTQFLKLADLAIDTKSPLFNQPLRAIDKSVLGGADQAKFDAGRAVALAEVSRVLNSPQGTGVVSDSARHEAQGLITGDATLEQIVEAAKILKTDMDNRKNSYQFQIDDIKRRIAAQPGQGQGAPAAAPKSGGFWDNIPGAVPRG